MATNVVFNYTETQTEIWTLTDTTAPGEPVMQGSVPGVTLTGTGDYTVSTKIGPLTISGFGRGGVGLEDKQATVVTDGTWDLSVEGATAAATQGTLVYFQADGDLSLTATDAKPFGKVNYPQDYVFHDTTLPVKIGVFA